MLEPEAGVVHEQVDRPRAVGEPGLDGCQLFADSEVRNQHLHLDAVLLPQLRGELLEPLAGAGHEDQVVAGLGQLPGEGAADPGGGAGDQGGAAAGCERHDAQHSRTGRGRQRDLRHDGPVLGPPPPHRRGRQPEGRRGEDDHGRLTGCRARRAGPTGAAGRPRPPGVLDLLPRHRPRGPRAVDPPRPHQGAEHQRGAHPHRRRRRPAAGHHRARTCRGGPADPHRSRARREARGRGPRLRLGPARLPAVARSAHRRRTHRCAGCAHPAAVRDAVAPRRRPAARHRARRAPVHQPRSRGVGRAAHAVRRTDEPRQGGAREHLRVLRARRARAAHPEVDPLRGGAGRGTVDPQHHARGTEVPMPTAKSRQASRGAGSSPVRLPGMGRDAAVTSVRPRYRRIGAAAHVGPRHARRRARRDRSDPRRELGAAAARRVRHGGQASSSKRHGVRRAPGHPAHGGTERP